MIDFDNLLKSLHRRNLSLFLALITQARKIEIFPEIKNCISFDGGGGMYFFHFLAFNFVCDV